MNARTEPRTERCFADRIPTPIGDVFAAVDEEGALVYLDFVGSKPRVATRKTFERELAREAFETQWSPSRLEPVGRALKRYFAGKLERFELDVAPRGSAFQKRVWKELLRIPFGQTISYGELARRVDRPGAARAVGRANATNPVSVVVPCHRVIGANGSLTGYGGGMQRKRELLRHEGALP